MRQPSTHDSESRLARVGAALLWLSACGGPAPSARVEEVSTPGPAVPAPSASAHPTIAAPEPAGVDDDLPEVPTLALVHADVVDTPCAGIASPTASIGFDKVGRSLVMLHDSGDQCVWKVEAGQLVRPRRIGQRQPMEDDGYRIAPDEIRFDPDGRWGVTIPADGEPRVWRLGRPGPPQHVRSIDTVTDALIAGDVAVFQSGDGKIVIWSMRRRRALAVTAGLGGIARMAIRPDGGALALADRNAVAAWALPDGAELLPRTGHYEGPLLDLAFVQGRLLAVSAGADRFAWDLAATESATEVVKVHLGAPGFDRAWLVPGSGDVLGVFDGAATLHRVDRSRTVRSHPLPAIRIDRRNKEYAALDVYFSSDGQRAVLDDRLGTWLIDVIGAQVVAAVRDDDCRGGHWALGPGGLVAAEWQLLCLGRQ